MKMHGKCFIQQAKLALVDIEGRRNWWHSSHPWFEMELLFYVAQEQFVATNAMKANMWKQGGSSLCRLCLKHYEIIMHIVSGCDILCGTK